MGTKMKKFWDMVEIKGTPIWKALDILDMYGHKIFLYNPIDKYYNQTLIENNKEAFQQALIELHHTV